MGGTGDSPVPSGDPPLGTGESAKQSVDFEHEKVLPVPSGQWPDGTGGSPVLPKVGEKCGLMEMICSVPVRTEVFQSFTSINPLD